MFLTVNSPETFLLLPGLFNSYISSFQPPPKTARRGLLTPCKRGTIIGLHLVLVLRDSHPRAKGASQVEHYMQKLVLDTTKGAEAVESEVG